MSTANIHSRVGLVLIHIESVQVTARFKHYVAEETCGILSASYHIRPLFTFLTAMSTGATRTIQPGDEALTVHTIRGTVQSVDTNFRLLFEQVVCQPDEA